MSELHKKKQYVGLLFPDKVGGIVLPYTGLTERIKSRFIYRPVYRREIHSSFLQVLGTPTLDALKRQVLISHVSASVLGSFALEDKNTVRISSCNLQSLGTPRVKQEEGVVEVTSAHLSALATPSFYPNQFIKIPQLSVQVLGKPFVGSQPPQTIHIPSVHASVVGTTTQQVEPTIKISSVFTKVLSGFSPYIPPPKPSAIKVTTVHVSSLGTRRLQPPVEGEKVYFAEQRRIAFFPYPVSRVISPHEPYPPDLVLCLGDLDSAIVVNSGQIMVAECIVVYALEWQQAFVRQLKPYFILRSDIDIDQLKRELILVRRKISRVYYQARWTSYPPSGNVEVSVQFDLERDILDLPLLNEIRGHVSGNFWQSKEAFIIQGTEPKWVPPQYLLNTFLTHPDDKYGIVIAHIIHWR